MFFGYLFNTNLGAMFWEIRSEGEWPSGVCGRPAQLGQQRKLDKDDLRFEQFFAIAAKTLVPCD